MEKVFGRHTATGRLVSGAYKSEYGDADELSKVMKRVEVSCAEVLSFSENSLTLEQFLTVEHCLTLGYCLIL